MKTPLFIAAMLYCTTISAQLTMLQSELEKIPGLKVNAVKNVHFREYYEVAILQPADHFKTGSNNFYQRVFIGFNGFSAPNVIDEDGYATDHAANPNHNNELAGILNGNLIVVEHRFNGMSTPDIADWQLLTVKQAAADCHAVKQMLDTILTGKWVSTGISKGGQAALAHKLYYPEDLAATVVYGTAVKNKRHITTDSVLAELSAITCGKKINGLQQYSFRNKEQLLPYFKQFTETKKYDFSPLDEETVLDYLLLELPYSFWQNGNVCTLVPDTTISFQLLTDYIVQVVSPRFFSVANRGRLAAAFYMFYHELGYYEYNTAPFKAYLKQASYPNSYFAPAHTAIFFDDSYQKAIINFLRTPAGNGIFFIYGQNDPWYKQTTANKHVFEVQDGSHKSRIANLTSEQQARFLKELNEILTK